MTTTHTPRQLLSTKAAISSGQFFPRRNQQHATASKPTSAVLGGAVARSADVYRSRMEKLEQEIALLTSYSGDTVYRLRYDTMKYDYISPAITKLLGFSPEEMKRIQFRSLILETKLVTNGMRIIQSFDELEAMRLKGDVGKWRADYLIRTKEGGCIWVSDVSHPWFDTAGNVIGSVGSLCDITDRIEAEQAMHQELARLANIDLLTGAGNRTEFFALLEKEIKRTHRLGTEISLLLLDMDNFRTIAESISHDVADRLLVEVSQIMQHSLRDTDSLTRIGEHEFAIILLDTPMQGGLWVAERILDRVKNHEFTLGVDNTQLHTNLSVGVASAVAGQDIDASSLFKLADTRLYIAKNSTAQVSVDEVRHTH